MKWFVMLMFISPVVNACKAGFVPSDTPGVCVEKIGGETNSAWVSDEKPPSDKMPSWQREGIKVLTDIPSMATSDEEADKAKAAAIEEGKRRAGIRKR